MGAATPTPTPTRRGRPSGTTAKSEATRARIFDAALELFAARGFEAATMREIAARARTSAGLAYRYFPAKESIVLELYRHLADEFAGAVALLPRGSVAVRFRGAMTAKLGGMEPHRRTLASLFSVGMNPASKAYVLGASTADVRAKVTEAMREVLRGATQRLPAARVESLAVLLYVLHLALVFCWIHDATKGAGATDRLVSLASRAVGLTTRLVLLPGVGGLLEELPAALGPIFART
jgi:AcrR family transcriptional regulator